MSVKIAAFRKLPPTEDYACSVLEVKEWAGEFADLRIEFGTYKSFQANPRCSRKLKIQGRVVASITIDCQLKPSLFFYPIAVAQYSNEARKDFGDHVLGSLKDWLREKLSKKPAEVVGHEMIVIELVAGQFNTHFLRYL